MIEGKLKHVSVGASGLWGVDQLGAVFYRSGTYGQLMRKGSKWVNVSGELTQLDVGYNVVWGVSADLRVFMRKDISPQNPEGSDWQQIEGRLNQVSVASEGFVWGVNEQGEIFHRVNASIANPVGQRWEQVKGNLKQVSVGSAGTFGVDKSNDVYYREGTHGNSGLTGTSWKKINGRKLKYISSGANFVIGVTPDNEIYKRDGITAVKPTGEKWVKVEGRLRQVEHYNYIIYGTNDNDYVVTCIET